MCMIAGYSGNRRAAPILLDMLRREQFHDGGVCTGIATIDNGKIYTVKIVGDVDDLIRSTDALDFPGTFGIAHSRPDSVQAARGMETDAAQGARAIEAHPFIDNSGNLALVTNGTSRDTDTPAFYEAEREMMQGFLDRGFAIRSAMPKFGNVLKLSNGLAYHTTEGTALCVGDLCDSGLDLCSALSQTLSRFPRDVVTLSIHIREPGRVAVGRITRPMVVGIGDGESFLATSAFAFPKNLPLKHVFPVPPASVSYIEPGTYTVTSCGIPGTRVQEITPSIYAKAYERLEPKLLAAHDDPPYFDEIEDWSYREWRDLWDTPYVDVPAQFVKPDGFLKPYAQLVYDLLCDFSRQGRLRMALRSLPDGRKRWKYWIEY